MPYGGRLDEIAQDRFGRTDWIELAAAVLLALATIVAAWSAYQATRWGGEQAKASRGASKPRPTQPSDTIFAAQVQVDVQLWTMWLQQAADDNELGRAFVEERFRDEFTPAFDAWLALCARGRAPPGTPFDMAEYAPEPATMPSAAER